MELVYILLLFVNITGYISALDDETQIETCKTGGVLQNECLQCICTANRIYNCIQKGSTACMEKVRHSKEVNKPTCRQNMVYTTNTMTCICDKEGHWPHRKCEEVFQNLNDTTDSCVANSYVILDCNVCRCGTSGRINKERCTMNICRNTRRSMSNVYGSCEIKNWYSLAPCQFCFCVSQNKLVCNTGNYYAKKLDLGSYHLNMCGQGLLDEAIALIPGNVLNLRYGNLLNTSITSTTQKLITPKHIKLQQSRNFGTNVHNANEIKTKKGPPKANDYSYSDTEEDDEPVTLKTVKVVDNTQFPSLDEEDSTSDENSIYNDEIEPELGMEINKENQHTTTQVIKTTKNMMTPSTLEPKSEETLNILGQNLGMTLKMSLPQMLDQMFKMALRKSMVSLRNDTECVPGTTRTAKCNTCFCLKNKKLLCTNNTCQ